MVKRPSQRQTRKKSTITVRKHFRGKERVTPETEVSQEIEVFTFDTSPASVTINYGLTMNLGNYESARCDVSITVPCYTEEIDEALKWASEKVEERIKGEVRNIKGK